MIFIFLFFFLLMSQFSHLVFIVVIHKCRSFLSGFSVEKSFVVYLLFLGCLSCFTLDVGVFLSRFKFYFLRSASPTWISSWTCSTWSSSSSMAVTSPGPQRSSWRGRFFAQMLSSYGISIFSIMHFLKLRNKDLFLVFSFVCEVEYLLKFKLTWFHVKDRIMYDTFSSMSICYIIVFEFVFAMQQISWFWGFSAWRNCCWMWFLTFWFI